MQELMRNYHKDASCPSRVVKAALDEFSLLSSRLANHARSNIFTSGVSHTINYYLCLPKNVLNIIEQKLRSFLWKGIGGDSKGAKICWYDVCLPKKEGGLGINDLSSWNKALMIRHIWILSYGTNNLWSSWIKAYHLKESNLGEAKAPCTCSWNWRKLLHLRPLVRPLIQHFIGNGSSTSLWFDNWHPDGPFLSKWSSRIVYDSGLPIHTIVSSIVHGDSWSWPATMSIDLFEIRSRMPSYNPNSNVDD
ncbi:hypothetical protein Dsin_012441 [Dipteronia sinensis]|uniref:Reverse transcriptase zinc-binding domain-containing protein n=1 Tax=Dipteronia sinensis TaxID=43782 RepID=A0AAE0AI12_9ROSI|nr:hypothetical protein Dsin_012441 [Dipteronia sinensis]